MITVFFDSNFYAWLTRKCSAAEAASVVERLNDCGARLVLSTELYQELTAGETGLGQTAQLADLLTGLVVPPLITEPYFAWHGLKVSAEFGSFQAELRRMTARAQALSLSAERFSVESSPPRVPSVEQAREHRKILESIRGLLGVALYDKQFAAIVETLDDFIRTGDVEAFEAAAMRNKAAADAVVRDLAQASPELTHRRNVQFSLEGKDGRIARLGDHHLLQFARGRPELQKLIQGQVSDQGPLKPKVFRRLVGTLVDTSRMSTFFGRQRHIDLLQIDGPQARRLDKNPQGHVLADFRQRCFSAKTVLEALEQVEASLPSMARSLPPTLTVSQCALGSRLVGALVSAAVVARSGIASDLIKVMVGATRDTSEIPLVRLNAGDLPRGRALAAALSAALVAQVRLVEPDEFERWRLASDYGSLVDRVRGSEQEIWSSINANGVQPEDVMSLVLEELDAVWEWVIDLARWTLMDQREDLSGGEEVLMVQPSPSSLGVQCNGFWVPPDFPVKSAAQVCSP